jgi:hypothetical protein
MVQKLNFWNFLMFKTPPRHVILDVEAPSVFLLNDKKETPFFSHFEEKSGVFLGKSLHLCAAEKNACKKYPLSILPVFYQDFSNKTTLFHFKNHSQHDKQSSRKRRRGGCRHR